MAWAITAKNPKSFLLVFLGVLPFGLLNLYWNYEACWCNLMFNAINRHEEGDSGWSLATPALYAASLAYLAALTKRILRELCSVTPTEALDIKYTEK